MRALPLLFLAACGGSLCDGAQNAVTCQNPNGQCVEFTGLSTSDQRSVTFQCTNNRGATISGACPTGGRLGTCVIPPSTPNSGVTCSPHGNIAIRYFAPFEAGNAQTLCTGVGGAWTPN